MQALNVFYKQTARYLFRIYFNSSIWLIKFWLWSMFNYQTLFFIWDFNISFKVRSIRFVHLKLRVIALYTEYMLYLCFVMFVLQANMYIWLFCVLAISGLCIYISSVINYKPDWVLMVIEPYNSSPHILILSASMIRCVRALLAYCNNYNIFG